MDQKSPDAPLDKQSPAVAPQTLLVYKARLDRIDFIKKQQWVVTNSVALIYVAIVWVGRNPSHPSPLLLWLLSAAIIVAGHHGTGILRPIRSDSSTRYFICRAFHPALAKNANQSGGAN